MENIHKIGNELFITSDEEIKEGDWYLNTSSNTVHKSNGTEIFDYRKGKQVNFKIILTTDQDLIKDGVQAIDDEFLEWFVKNSSCEKVDVVSAKTIPALQLTGNGHCWWKIIIPKEEPKQETTLEEFIFKVPFDYNIKPKEVIDMCMKEQENIILTWRLGYFIDMINALPEDTEKNRILKSVFDNRDGELLLESYKSMKSHYEK